MAATTRSRMSGHRYRRGRDRSRESVTLVVWTGNEAIVWGAGATSLRFVQYPYVEHRQPFRPPHRDMVADLHDRDSSEGLAHRGLERRRDDRVGRFFAERSAIRSQDRHLDSDDAEQQSRRPLLRSRGLDRLEDDRLGREERSARRAVRPEPRHRRSLRPGDGHLDRDIERRRAGGAFGAHRDLDRLAHADLGRRSREHVFATADLLPVGRFVRPGLKRMGRDAYGRSAVLEDRPHGGVDGHADARLRRAPERGPVRGRWGVRSGELHLVVASERRWAGAARRPCVRLDRQGHAGLGRVGRRRSAAFRRTLLAVVRHLVRDEPRRSAAGIGASGRCDDRHRRTVRLGRAQRLRRALARRRPVLRRLDGDGLVALCDNCPSIANPSQVNSDGDGSGDACDNCPNVSNPDQADVDHDGLGDACDPCPLDAANDVDGDGVCGNLDNCPPIPNPTQSNVDGDAFGDACDPCPLDSLNDADGDGRCANVDNCPSVANAVQLDSDADGLGDYCDNCPSVANANQADADGDGAGDACDCQPNDSNDRKPAEVNPLNVAKTGTIANLTWGAVGDADAYSVTRGDLASKAVNQYGTCLTDGLSSPSYDDATMPTPGQGFYYLVQAQNHDCGLGSLGTTSSEQQRTNSNSGACTGVAVTDTHASAESNVFGTVSGTLANTQSSNNLVESMTEVLSSGNPSSRFSELDHRWTISVGSGSTEGAAPGGIPFEQHGRRRLSVRILDGRHELHGDLAAELAARRQRHGPGDDAARNAYGERDHPRRGHGPHGGAPNPRHSDDR